MTKPLAVTALALLALAGCKPAVEAATSPDAAQAAPVADPVPAASRQAQRKAAEQQAKFEHALVNQTYIDDPGGQWAASATASSTYATTLGNPDRHWKPEAATGAPDAESTRYPENGWSPQQEDAGIEWLELRYDSAVSATAVRVREVGALGSVVQVELVDAAGARHRVWQGRDSAPKVPNDIHWFQASFEATPYKTRTVRLILATNTVAGRASIDAVQLVGQ